jgi:hypothetical protein|tara:strand:+ start:92 stop:280 length:189 start_codon:yes stop_codon:yes gene_type:complete
MTTDKNKEPGTWTLSQDDIDLMRRMFSTSIRVGKRNGDKLYVQKVQQFRDQFDDHIIETKED